MGISIDTIVNTLAATVLHPIALLGYIGYRSYEAKRLPPRDGLLTTAYIFLCIRFSKWCSNRWRNGLIPQSRLNAQTWNQELALITGGAQGIGKQTAEQLAKKGCQVVSIDIVKFQSTHPNIHVYQCDIGNYEALERLRDQIRKDFNGKEVTMVANIAGLNNKSLILDLNRKKVDSMIDVNLKSHFYTAMLFLPAMIKRKRGHFLSVASTMGYVGICHQSDYVATKHGLVGMQESLYYEMQKMYKTPNVRTSIAIIGHTKTGLFETFNVGPIGRFLGPLLEPEYVASLLVDAFEAQETRIILTPFMNNLTPSIKAHPSFVRDLIQSMAGGDGSYPSRPSAAQLGHA